MVNKLFKKQDKKQDSRRGRTGSSDYVSVRTRRGTSADKKPRNLFRRGQTIQGSTAQGLDDAQPHTLRSATPREKVRHLSKIRRLTMTFLFAVVVVGGVLAVVIQQFTATVHVAVVDAPQMSVSQREVYADVMQSYLQSHPTERLRFNANIQTMTSYIQREHPEVLSIQQVGSDGFATSYYKLTMRRPIASWDVGGSKRYYVDANGVSFTKSFYPEPNVKIVDNSGVRYESGQAIASERFLGFVGRVVSYARDSSLTVASISIPAGSTRQVEVHVDGTPTGYIMSIERGAAEQVEDMSRVIAYFSSQHRQAKYVDLRVQGKAFYRE